MSGPTIGPITKLAALLTQASAAADDQARERAYVELTRLLTIFVRAGMSEGLRRQRESLDICQSVIKSFVGEMHEGKVSFPNEAALVAYVQQVVRSKLAEVARRDGAWKRGGRAEIHTIGSGDGQNETSNQPTTASTHASAKEIEEELLRSLAPEDLELLRLRRAGMEWSAIAVIVGKDSATLRKHWSRLQRRIDCAFLTDSE